jgi:hypothetical protein
MAADESSCPPRHGRRGGSRVLPGSRARGRSRRPPARGGASAHRSGTTSRCARYQGRMRRTTAGPYPRLVPGRRPGRLRAGRAVADTTIAFCEKCGRDRDVFRNASDAFRVCPRCASACCPDCWNQTGGGCLACVPFSIPPGDPRRSIAPAPGGARAAGGGPGATAGGREGRAAADGDGTVARRAAPTPASRTPRSLPAHPVAAPSASTLAAADGGGTVQAGHRTGSGRRAVRFLAGVAMSAVVVVGLSVAALAATWPQGSSPAPAAPPSAAPAGPVEVAATAQPTAPPAESARPHAARSAAPVTPRPVAPRASDRPAVPRRTAAPAVIVAPPAPRSTPTPRPTEPPPPPPTVPPPPEPTPDPPAEPSPELPAP